MRRISIGALRDIEDSRPAGEGFSIENSEYREYVGKELSRLSDAMETWTQEHDGKEREGDSPFYNSGYRFINDTFIACAYDWSDYELNVNFYHFGSHVDITWYKHAWRGTYGHNVQTSNAIENGELSRIVDECIASLERTEENQFVWE